MAENLIFNEPELAFTDLGNGLFAWQSDTVIIPLTAGETYIVEWDGTRHTCEAVSTVFDNADVVVIGNFGIVGAGENNDMPFLMGTAAAGDLSLCYTVDQDAANSVAIYLVTEDETGGDTGGGEGSDEGETEPETPEETREGIILKDRKGNDVAYYGIETVTFDTTTEGKQQVYTKGVAVEELEIVPDFSGGDMPITAAEGTLVKSAVVKKPDALKEENIRSGEDVGGIKGTFIGDTEELIIGEAEGETPLNFAESDQMVITPSAPGKVISKVTVKKPEGLTPGNIAKDENVAGVVGTHEGGGGEAVAISGEYTPTETGAITIAHNLGVQPDIIYVSSEPYNTDNGLVSVTGFCGGIGAAQYVQTISPSVGINSLENAAQPIEDADASGYGFINDATPLTFTLGGSIVKHISGRKYKWTVIGGLVKHEGYIALVLALDGMGGLIISGGVPEMTKVDVYSDGVYCGTVDYAHAEAVTVDISSMVDSRKKHTITVQLTDESLSEQYENIWIGEVYGWVSEPASGYALIDLDMARNGENMGTGGSDYNPTIAYSGAFADGKFVVRNSTGALTVPTPFMYGTGSWTVAFAVDKYTPNTGTYGRFARGDKDVPSMFYQRSVGRSLFKMAAGSVFPAQVEYYDSTDVLPWGTNSANALSVSIPQATRTIIAYRNDGEYITMWINGKLKVKQVASMYTSTYWASTFGLGNTNNTANGNFASMDCSMLKLWDYALTDEKMALID